MFGSPVLNLVLQGNIQAAANLNILSVGGPQSVTQNATNTATVTTRGTIGSGS